MSKHPATLLILDDDESILLSLELFLNETFDKVITASSKEQFKASLSATHPDVVLMDMNYTRGAVSGSEGLALLKEVRANHLNLPVIVMTAYSEVELVIESMKLGAADFIQKPWQNHRLIITLENAIKHSVKTKEVERYKASVNHELHQPTKDEFGMIGASNAMRLVKDKIKRIASSDANVLILGENGTGKEVVAQAIHLQSERNEKPFIKIDLGTIHEQLFESELFGAKKGAYTGLTKDKIGRISMAQQGTLFLDEIGNLSLPMQAKLLSTFQNREVIPVGGTQPEKIDIRLVSATNLPINDLLDDQQFRQDLLYRINTVEIQIPPLRERKEDIPLLLNYFTSLYADKYHLTEVKFAPNLMNDLMQYHWPGNVRELQHATERALLMCTNNTLKAEDLIIQRPKKKEKQPDGYNLEAMEKTLIAQALRANQGNISKTAKDLGITRAALYRRLEKHNL